MNFLTTRPGTARAQSSRMPDTLGPLCASASSKNFHEPYLETSRGAEQTDSSSAGTTLRPCSSKTAGWVVQWDFDGTHLERCRGAEQSDPSSAETPLRP